MGTAQGDGESGWRCGDESDLRIDYPGGNWVRLFGADNPDAFRSAYFHGLSFDEFGQHPPNIFSESLSKALADHLGYGVFVGTIKGKNQLWRTWDKAKRDPDWFALWQDVNVSLATETGATILALRQAMHDDQGFIAKGLIAARWTGSTVTERSYDSRCASASHCGQTSWTEDSLAGYGGWCAADDRAARDAAATDTDRAAA